MQDSYDVVVVGGGAAGLSGALALVRARRSVLVVDEGAPRNASVGHVHNYLGLEGVSPVDLLAAGRAEVTGYGGEVVPGRVTTATPRTDSGEGLSFAVELADGTAVQARRLLVTTGLVDELPDVPGVAARWGRDVLHCPYCHGWEVRDQALGVLATGPMAVFQALLFRQWSADVVLFTHTQQRPDPADLEQLAARDIEVVGGRVAELVVQQDRLTGVRLDSGALVARQALVVAPRFTARAGVLKALGLEVVEERVGEHALGSVVPADASGATAVPGVWVAGNVADLPAQVISAAAAGLTAAAALNADLIGEDTRAAVAASRAAAQPQPAEEFWEAFYGQREHVWSGRPNGILVREVSGLRPGTALDLGCGEGADAIWLARQGWQVTAVDVSPTALDRAAAHARSAGVAELVDWQQHDLSRSFPAGTFDLVSAHFLHSPVEVPGSRDKVLGRAAESVAPGGTLLIAGHAGGPSWQQPSPEHHVHFPTPEEVLQALDVDPGQWEVERCETFEVELHGPDGQPGTRLDNVLRIRRRQQPGHAILAR